LKKRISGACKTNPFAERLREVIVAFATISGVGPYLGVIKSEIGGLWPQIQLDQQKSPTVWFSTKQKFKCPH
jgi:hypothetical protein